MRINPIPKLMLGTFQTDGAAARLRLVRVSCLGVMISEPVLVAEVAPPSATSSPIIPPALANARRFQWIADGTAHVLDCASLTDGGSLGPYVTFPIAGWTKRASGDIAPDGTSVVYATQTEVACVLADGTVRWQIPLDPPAHSSIGRADCAFSLDGKQLWLYLPDAMLGRGEDCWRVLDPADGTLIAETTLPTVGQGAVHAMHPDGQQVILDVGEGQDGLYLFRGSLDGGRLVVEPYSWHDQGCAAMAPDGLSFMTLSHEEDEITFWTFPEGQRQLSLTLDAFGPPIAGVNGADNTELDDADENDEQDDEFAADVEVEDLARFGFDGGYLDAARAMILVDDTGDMEEHRHFLVDVATGRPLTQLRVAATETPMLLGDGSWLSIGDEGKVTRWRMPHPPHLPE
ncbi:MULTISPECIES: hypothetical protein [unclassified Micromonospora]|uniref:hypothetical protein n=1 Tax=unclassified Micromonospora TaxID=2617518 RepID=UPI002FEEC96F